MSLYGNSQVTGNERLFDENDLIVSKTDLTGKLVYGNNTFYRLAGMTEKQCLGQQHNIIRHPEMPRSVFEYLWQTLKTGKELFAFINNRSVNGDNYWVFAHVTPSRDGSGNIMGYHSNRRTPNRMTLQNHIIPFYSQLLEIEKQNTSPKEGLQAAVAKIQSMLQEKHMSFNQLMLSLQVQS